MDKMMKGWRSEGVFLRHTVLAVAIIGRSAKSRKLKNKVTHLEAHRLMLQFFELAARAA